MTNHWRSRSLVIFQNRSVCNPADDDGSNPAYRRVSHGPSPRRTYTISMRERAKVNNNIKNEEEPSTGSLLSDPRANFGWIESGFPDGLG
jgi:hypothetical protein